MGNNFRILARLGPGGDSGFRKACHPRKTTSKVQIRSFSHFIVKRL